MTSSPPMQQADVVARALEALRARWAQTSSAEAADHEVLQQASEVIAQLRELVSTLDGQLASMRWLAQKQFRPKSELQERHAPASGQGRNQEPAGESGPVLPASGATARGLSRQRHLGRANARPHSTSTAGRREQVSNARARKRCLAVSRLCSMLVRSVSGPCLAGEGRLPAANPTGLRPAKARMLAAIACCRCPS